MDEMNNNQMNNNENRNENVNENTGENMDEDVRDGGEMAVAAGSSTMFIVLGWIAAILSLIAYPFIFGVVGVIMGILATKNGSRAGLPLIVASIIFMSVGLMYSGVIMNYLRHYLGL